MELAVEVFRDKDNKYIAFCPKLEIYSYGYTLNMAVSRLEKIVNFYIQTAEEMGVTLDEICGGSKISRFPEWQENWVRRRIIN